MYNLALIDNDPNQLFLNRILFSKEAVFQQIETFDDPSIALDTIINKEDISNDIFIVDINMPQMNAWQFLDTLSLECCLKKKHNLKLFLASFTSNPKDIATANEHNLVTKFISKDHLIPSIKTYLKTGT